MNIRIDCPECQAPCNVDDSLVGEKGLCPGCGARFVIPQGTDAAPASPQTPAPAVLPVQSGESRVWQILLSLAVAGGYAASVWWLLRTQPHGVTAGREISVAGGLHPLLLHLPIGLLTDDGKVYLLLEDHADEEPYEKARKLAGERAKVQGKQFSERGLPGLLLHAAEGL